MLDRIKPFDWYTYVVGPLATGLFVGLLGYITYDSDGGCWKGITPHEGSIVHRLTGKEYIILKPFCSDKIPMYYVGGEAVDSYHAHAHVKNLN